MTLLSGQTIHKLVHITDPIRKRAASSFENHDYNMECDTWRCEERRLELQEQATAVKECILSHKKAIEFVHLMSKLFRWTEMAMSGIYVIGELIHIFFLSLMAQFIFDHSLKVRESAYSCSWYNMPTKIQKDVVMILMRSRLPCKVMAGQLFVMSLENFCAILQTSMSYFTVLASFR
ncbi:PREDICTED: odorant receptor 4-like [Dinoponera quadriceps]|uniref:Odorant receptor 4-like n=1 Tax=Dinoponera quadriceps TaxID=609295 RepID=A0A6P3XEY8_DINQU|nr:PREDICTED: odorant receptor 4-like [Dinoponera quadriceps]